ncbi:hypothetical protein DEU56DRAFT_970604 [Suillus clintonianus]|uniref:uncharacterized protein n=1 Tax=Suillus clintonianus TaxID=1904413 RepID=UPI001B878C78|nr:uncharacterized protein DEU56DRAFT_970604 [Suillus clintonianus]KAG2151501.1 hypothetical protein DEU56DRAFT_970604 [Suillus clintonianus]
MTKHWENVYEEELENFSENGDEGEIWFGNKAMSEMVKWLAQSVAHSRNLTAICGFLQGDPSLLADDQKADQNGAWDLILDKGTYDAIVLMEKGDNGRITVDVYPMRVAKLLNPGGYFLIACQGENPSSPLNVLDMKNTNPKAQVLEP